MSEHVKGWAVAIGIAVLLWFLVNPHQGGGDVEFSCVAGPRGSC
jgi:hypothetical protein